MTKRIDWTRVKSGRSNSSPAFEAAVADVYRTIRENGGWNLGSQWLQGTARLIVARLAHVHGFRPPRRSPKKDAP